MSIDRKHIDALYEPLTDDEKRALLSAIRHYSVPGPNPTMSSAANKLEAQLHRSVTGYRIYEGPPSKQEDDTPVIERIERIGELRDHECNGTTCALCDEGIQWVKEGDRYFHRCRDEVVVRYVPEREVEQLRDKLAKRAGDLDRLVCEFCKAVGEPIPVDAIAVARQQRESLNKMRERFQGAEQEIAALEAEDKPTTPVHSAWVKTANASGKYAAYRYNEGICIAWNLFDSETAAVAWCRQWCDVQFVTIGYPPRTDFGI